MTSKERKEFVNKCRNLIEKKNATEVLTEIDNQIFGEKEKIINENTGKTPLHFAIERGSYPIIKILLEKGGDINLKTSFSESPVKSCDKKELKEFVQYYHKLCQYHITVMGEIDEIKALEDTARQCHLIASRMHRMLQDKDALDSKKVDELQEKKKQALQEMRERIQKITGEDTKLKELSSTKKKKKIFGIF